jgi:hypothetical protein
MKLGSRCRVGRTETALFRKGVLESTMDNVIADALREASGAYIGMTNGFRFSYPVPPGPMTEEDLLNIFPMDAGIKVGKTLANSCAISGKMDSIRCSPQSLTGRVAVGAFARVA